MTTSDTCHGPFMPAPGCGAPYGLSACEVHGVSCAASEVEDTWDLDHTSHADIQRYRRLLAACMDITGARTFDEMMAWLETWNELRDAEAKGPTPTLESDIARVINFHSAENGSDTPDFLLAQFLLGCLATFNRTVTLREKWYGRTKETIGGDGPGPVDTEQPSAPGPCRCGRGYDSDGDGDCPACAHKES